jgi:predicted Zn finger-like uncharacterized protein
MNLTFVCQSCEDSFDVDLSRLTEDAKGLKCPNCGKKLTPAETDDLATAIDEVLSQVAGLRKRFLISFAVDAEDLPPPYESEGKRAARGHGEDDEEETDDEDADHLEDEEVGGEDEDDF